MRPRLDPMMGQTVLCARVALQLTRLTYNRIGRITFDGSHYAVIAARELPLDYPGFLRFALHSLAVYLDIGYSSHQWLEQVLEASHFGNSFRRCFFFAYKEHRSPYPRVTNRGVQTSSKAANARVRKGRLNA